MISCTAAIASSGKPAPLPMPESLELQAHCASPACQATLTFAMELPPPRLDTIEIACGAFSTPLFTGRLDEQAFTLDQSGGRLLLSARSLGGALLDNEAAPASYNRPDLQAVFLLHAAPYGLTGALGEGCCPGVYTVAKGQSEWEVLSDFCSMVCGWRPRITEDGILDASPPGRGDALLLSNREPGGIRYASARRISRPYGTVTELRYRPDRENGYLYTMRQEGPLPARRLLDLAQTPAWRGRQEAEWVLRRSLAGSEELIVETPFSFPGRLGDAVHAPDEACAPIREDWCIWAIGRHLSRSSAGCTVTLRPRDHF